MAVVFSWKSRCSEVFSGLADPALLCAQVRSAINQENCAYYRFHFLEAGWGSCSPMSWD
jgi:hypothetical protein